ncbi:MAG: SDR family NAD(P)-dependent oxidoreductase, partial [Chloroflexota bacterium]
MDQRDVIDALLELAVVPSFTRIGPLVRSRLWAWTDPAPDALAGRTALITGATGGLGRATAEALASLGARVILVGRDQARLDRLQGELAAASGAVKEAGAHPEPEADRFPTFVADMASLEDVRRMAGAIRAAETRLDILVDNAGAIFAERTTSVDGIESSMALMAIGPFVLTAGLLPLLRESPDARVVAVTSGGQYTQPIDVDDLDGVRTAYGGPRFYA